MFNRNFREYIREYHEKFTFADEVVKLVTPGSTIHFVFGVMNSLDMALAARRDELEDISIFSHIPYDGCSVLKADPSGSHFNLQSIADDRGRTMEKDRKKSVLRIRREIESSLDEAIFMAVVSPMDGDGYFWLSHFAAPYSRKVAQRAHTVIIEINEYIPSRGNKNNSCIHISEVSHIVPGINSRIATLEKNRGVQYAHAK